MGSVHDAHQAHHVWELERLQRCGRRHEQPRLLDQFSGARVSQLQPPTTPSPSTFKPKTCLKPLQFDDTLTWADIEWVKSVWQGPLVVKGIMSKEDAVRGSPVTFVNYSHC